MFGENLDVTEVAARLGLGDDFRAWLRELEMIGPPPSPVRLPDKHEIGDLLSLLGVEATDAAEIMNAWLQPSQAPEMWWLLQRCHQQLVAHLGEPCLSLQWQPLPPHLGAPGRLFYVYVFLSALGVVRQWHRERGITDDVSWATLADLGEHIAIYRRMFGVTGLGVPRWLTRHFGGGLYRLGRLQFERSRFSAEWPMDSDERVGDVPAFRPSPGVAALSVHVPESGGPLQPTACAHSFAWARSFFAHYFPEETYRFAFGRSWLFDPQLADYLPASSNIVSFQRLFRLAPGRADGDENIVKFVFRRADLSSLDDLPQRTTLERAVVSHLRAGGHWQERSGWLAL